MIQAYCSRCNKDLGILPRPVCSKDMICRGCFRDISKEGIKAEIEEIRMENMTEEEKKEFDEWNKIQKQKILELS